MPTLPWPWLVLGLAWAADVGLGELPNRLHPVAWFGSVVGLLKGRLFAKSRSPAVEFCLGLTMACALPTLASLLVMVVLKLLSRHPLVHGAVGLFFLSSSFALRTLGDAGKRVWRAVDTGELQKAREGLGWLCSRDPSQLSGAELTMAAMESISENLSDSVIAPLFYFWLFGVPGAVFYRCVNTLDAMVGYRGKWEYIGKAGARLDDALNWLPARLTALLLLMVSVFQPARLREGLTVGFRDHRLTESPNAGVCMATFAGLVGVRLEKPGHYALNPKAPLPTAADAERGWVLVRAAAWLWVVFQLIWWAGVGRSLLAELFAHS